MKRIKITELKKISKDGGYKVVSLQNAKDEYLVKNNSPKIDFDKRVDEVITRLKSPGIPDGNYCVCFRSSHGRRVEPDRFEIVKGEEIVDHIVLSDPVELEAGKVRSFNAAIDDKTEIQKLIFEKEILVRDNARLEAELENSRTELQELKEDIDLHFEEEEDGLADNPQKDNLQFFQGMADTIAPIVQGIIDNVKDSNNIRAAQLLAGTQFNKPLLERQPVKPKGKFQPEEPLFGFDSVEEIQNSTEIEPGDKDNVISNWLNNLSHIRPEEYTAYINAAKD